MDARTTWLALAALGCRGPAHTATDTALSPTPAAGCAAFTALRVIEVSQPDETAGWFHALAVSDDCTAHLATLVNRDDDPSDAELAYATVRAGAVTWTDLSAAGADLSGEVDLELDAAGRRIFAYAPSIGGPGALMVAYDDGASWTELEVDRGAGDAGMGGWNAIALASDGELHVAWEDGGYAVGDEHGFFAMADWADDLLIDVDLTLADDGTPVIAAHTTDDKVRVVHVDGSGVTEVLEVDDLGGNTGFDPAIAMDGAVHHVVYAIYDGDPTDLRYATDASGVLVHEVLDSGEGVGGHPRLAVADGTAHLAYAALDRGALMYGSRPAGGSWTLTEVGQLHDLCGVPGTELAWDQDDGTPDLAVRDGVVFLSFFSQGSLCLASFPVGAL